MGTPRGEAHPPFAGRFLELALSVYSKERLSAAEQYKFHALFYRGETKPALQMNTCPCRLRKPWNSGTMSFVAPRLNSLI